MIFVRPLLNKIIKIPYASIDAEAGAQPPFKKKRGQDWYHTMDSHGSYLCKQFGNF
jgi:hypothetical protein